MVVRLSALRTGLLYHQEILLVLISVRGWVDPRILCQWNIPLTPAVIEPATYRFVARHLNHCAAAVSSDSVAGWNYKMQQIHLRSFITCLTTLYQYEGVFVYLLFGYTLFHDISSTNGIFTWSILTFSRRCITSHFVCHFGWCLGYVSINL